MKWEAGKEYKTAGGYRARIYATDGGFFPIHGAIFIGKQWHMIQWEEDGRPDDSQYKGLLTIEEWNGLLTSEEWKEPEKPKRRLAWLSNCESAYLCDPIFVREGGPVKHGMQRAPWLDPPADWSPE